MGLFDLSNSKFILILDEKIDCMRFRNYLLLFPLVALSLIGCKKDEPAPVAIYEPNIAPCAVSEEVLEIADIIYGPSSKFPYAYMTIIFHNTSQQFAFNKLPATGMYRMVPNLVGSYGFDNEIATVKDSGSFQVYSGISDYEEVYIENYNNELIISYCDLSNGGEYTFDPSINCYIGHPSTNRKVRMSY